jgi:hypothetical protein
MYGEWGDITLKTKVTRRHVWAHRVSDTYPEGLNKCIRAYPNFQTRV